jgi:hypothetical protein
MAQAASISLSKFTETVQAAVKVAVQKHPKFKLEQPTQLSISCHRWYSQEGAAACMRCPEITTVTYDLSPETREVSGLPVITET